MPILDFEASDGEIFSVHVKLNAPKEDFQTQVRKEDGKIFKRIYSAPKFSRDMLIGDASKDDFRRVVEGKNDTVGQVWARSKELSEQRAAKNGGIDPVMEKFYEKYEKETRKKHKDVIKRERDKTIEKLRKDWGVKIEF